MAKQATGPSWKPHDIVRLTNQSNENIHLHLSTGEYRLDAGRSMKFTATILEFPQVKELLAGGTLVWEKIGKSR